MPRPAGCKRREGPEATRQAFRQSGLRTFYSVKWLPLEPIRLPFGARPARPPEELGRIHTQDGGQPSDDLQPDIGHRPLDPAEVGPVHLGVVGQIFLGQLPVVPDPAEVGAKSWRRSMYQAKQPVV